MDAILKNFLTCSLLLATGCEHSATAAQGSSRGAAPPVSMQSSRAGQESLLPLAAQALVKPHEAILAFGAADLQGDATKDAVLILGNGTSTEPRPCRFVVLLNEGGTYRIVAENRHIVDCAHRNVIRVAHGLDDSLELAPGSIRFTDQGVRDNTTYGFRYSEHQRAWYVADVTRHFPQYDDRTDQMLVYRERAEYPDDFGWIDLSGFDPSILDPVLRSNRKLID